MIELSDDGQYLPCLAERFEWRGSQLIITVRPNLLAADGLPITINDVAFSMWRLLKLGTATHGDLAQLLCPDNKSGNSEKSGACQNIVVEGDRLVLSFRQKSDLIIDNLTSIDFSILPERAVDPITLKIKDYGITTGLYFVSKHSAKLIEFAVNKHHPKYSTEIPQKFSFVAVDSGLRAGLESYLKHEVDFIHSIDLSDIGDRYESLKNDKLTNIHITQKIRLEMLKFTSAGLDLSESRRWAIGRKFKQAFKTKLARSSIYENADQYFPAGGIGSLKDRDLENVKQNIENSDSKEEGEGLIFGCHKTKVAFYETFLKPYLPKIKIIAYTKLPDFYTPAEKAVDYPHMFVVIMDTGFIESLPIITVSIKSGFLVDPDRKDMDAWIAEYSSTIEELERAKMLRSLHLKSLNSPRLIPLLRSPYMAAGRLPMKFRFSAFTPNTPIWKISTK